MSFILEQLKKSGRKHQIELEMRKGHEHPASEHSMQMLEKNGRKSASSGPFKRTTLIYLVLAVVLINGSLLVWWLLPRVFEKTERVDQSGYIVKQGKTTSGPEKGVGREQISRQFAVLPDAKSVLNDKQETEMKGLSASLSGAGLSKRPVLNKDLSESLSSETEALSMRIDQNSRQMEGGRKIQDTEFAGGENKTNPKNLQIETYTAASKDIDEKSKAIVFEDLPVSLRKKLPELRIASHLYSNNRKSRLVSINGRIMQEGYNMSDGLYLEEITRDGVILDYQGYRFHKKAE